MLTWAPVVLVEEVSSGWVWATLGSEVMFAVELDVQCERWRILNRDARAFVLSFLSYGHVEHWGGGMGILFFCFSLVSGFANTDACVYV